MMMQIVRCESAVAQGLRSDTLQATKKAESASMQPPPPHSLWPVGCGPPPAHNQPRSRTLPISDIGISKSKKNTCDVFFAIPPCYLFSDK